MVLMLSVHPSRQNDLLTEHCIRLSNVIASHDYRDTFGNTCTRLVAPPGLLEIRNDFVIADSGLPDEVVGDATQWDVAALPDEALMYLMGSRYCDTQKLSDLAWSQVRRHEWRLAVRAGDLRLRARPPRVRLPPRPLRPHRVRRTCRARWGLPGLCPSRGDSLSLHEYSGPLLHGLSRGYRRAQGSRTDGF